MKKPTLQNIVYRDFSAGGSLMILSAECRIELFLVALKIVFMVFVVAVKSLFSFRIGNTIGIVVH